MSGFIDGLAPIPPNSDRKLDGVYLLRPTGVVVFVGSSAKQYVALPVTPERIYVVELQGYLATHENAALVRVGGYERFRFEALAAGGIEQTLTDIADTLRDQGELLQDSRDFLELIEVNTQPR